MAFLLWVCSFCSFLLIFPKYRLSIGVKTCVYLQVILHILFRNQINNSVVRSAQTSVSSRTVATAWLRCCFARCEERWYLVLVGEVSHWSIPPQFYIYVGLPPVFQSDELDAMVWGLMLADDRRFSELMVWALLNVFCWSLKRGSADNLNLTLVMESLFCGIGVKSSALFREIARRRSRSLFLDSEIRSSTGRRRNANLRSFGQLFHLSDLNYSLISQIYLKKKNNQPSSIRDNQEI